MKKTIIIVLFAFALIVVAYLSVNVSIYSTISDEVVGRWEGSSEVFADFKLDESPSSSPDDLIFIQLKIKQDGSVSGIIGDALLENGIIKKNRNNLGKFLGINSDYIIVNATIRGKINVHDKLESRRVSIPLDFEANSLKGSINLKEAFKYPDPIFPRLKLKPVAD